MTADTDEGVEGWEVVEIPNDVADRFLKCINYEAKMALRSGEDSEAARRYERYGQAPTLVHGVIRWWEDHRPSLRSGGLGVREQILDATSERLMEALDLAIQRATMLEPDPDGDGFVRAHDHDEEGRDRLVELAGRLRDLRTALTQDREQTDE